MAGAEEYKKLELERLEVPKRLVKGSKFIKWPKSDGDDTIIATPVTLRLDPKGYILYWQEPNRDTECLDVSNIRDTRIGKYARLPRPERLERALQGATDPQIREVAGNPSIPLEMKCLTVVYGMKFPEPNFLNFIAVEENPHDLVKMWADFLLQLVYHPLTWHISVETAVEKMHTKLKYETNQFGQIPVKKCIKMFGGNSKRVESALHSVGLTRGKKDEVIEPEDFPLIAFKKVMQLACQRPELDKVFTQLGAKRMSLSLEQLKNFLNGEQRDPRLNEIIYPILTDEQVETIIQKYEPNIMLSRRCQLSLEGLDAYLQSNENLCVSTTRYAEHTDMTHPISHYFINSSHNTYLTGTQYKSKSTAEIYRQCLLAGCRCVELDCWEGGTNDEPMINHGFTLCSPVPFKDVVEAINEAAFKTSKYPVILSFENHVDNPQQQAKMAQYCRDIFGDKLLIDPLEAFPLEADICLPSPKDLLGKIVIKNKKQKIIVEGNKKQQSDEKALQQNDSFDSPLEYDIPNLKYKRGSIPSDSGVYSPLSSASPTNSPGFFPSNKVARNSSSASSKADPPVGRKRSEPSIATGPVLSPLVNSPSLPITRSDNNLTMQNGTVSPSKGNRSGSSTPTGTGRVRKTSRLANIENIREHNEEDQQGSARTVVSISVQARKQSVPSFPVEVTLTKMYVLDVPTPDHEVKKEDKTSDYGTPPQTPTGKAGRKSSAASTSSDRTKEKEETTVNGGTSTQRQAIKKKQNSQEENNNNDEEQKEEKDEESKDDSTSEETESKEKVDDEEDSDDEGSISFSEFDQNAKECGTAMRESRAYEAMSSLVNYIQPVRFKSFEYSEKRNRSYEISSFTENAALRLITYYPIDIVNYNKRQMSRIYPKGARMDSSNYNPQVFWNVGCQLVALNFQTLDPPMQLNLGLFEFNGNCGYLLKPEHMRRKDRMFDPFAENMIDGVVAGSLNIRIISGQFLSPSRVSTYVEVDMYGLVSDTVRKKYKTSTVNNNGTNPHYDSAVFSFKKIVLPSMATLRIGVMDTNGNCLGQRFLPVEGLRPGYRYITLRNEGNQPLTMPSLFVHIEVRDYIPDKLKDWAKYLENPIEHIRKQEEEEKEIRGRQNALKRLLDDDEKKMLFSENPLINDMGKPKKEEEKPIIMQIEPGTEPPPNTTDAVRVFVHPEEPVEKTEGEKEKSTNKKGVEPLKPFHPSPLDDIKETGKYQKLQKKMDDCIVKFLKEQKNRYDHIYKAFFENPRRPSAFNYFQKKLRPSSSSQINNLNLPFEIDSTLPADAKKDQMFKVLRIHFAEEEKFRLSELEKFMRKFEDIARDFQKVEMDKLDKITKTEIDEVQERKNAEKDAKFRKIPGNLDKDEIERRKKDIVDTHVQECVRDRKMLGLLQEQRLEQVKAEQQEILMMLNEEERNRGVTVTDHYNQQIQDIAKIYDIRRADYYRRRGNNAMNINSVNYPSDELGNGRSDGMNDGN